MKYLIWTLLLFAAAVVLVTAAHNPAYVLLVYPPYRIELSLTLFVVLLLLAFIFGYGLVRLLSAAVRLPEYVRRFRIERSQAKARKLMDESLGAFFEGRYAAAEKASAQAMELGDASALHSIIAARAAHELHEFEKRDAYLAASEGKSVGDATMRLMATTKFMLDQRDPQAALHALKELRDSGVKGHTGAMSLELKARQLAGDWDEVLNVLDQLEKRAAIDVTVAAQIRQQAWLEKIRQQEDLDGLAACLKAVPADFKRRSKVAATAARALIQHGGSPLAQQLLSDSLNAQWDSELVALYGDCRPADGASGDVLRQIEQAEKWLNQHRDDAGLLLALGKLCLHQGLWGKAQSYLDASISVAPSPAAYTALGQLAERLGKPQEAGKYFQRAAALK
ncbi:heme biosynthesis protein HemY [Ferrigenium kumadai]|uniref:Heme biosynthesis protein HemY n=1 Tax=Ferrigenium kumadai TaxID=1682490 RepID=A0AAN1VZK5_9PROT|nr:heme biosynthesis HemY N-terminal domain-containing protein [Ferrigenium kumadai]BBI98601.1 heme biosynthesis protein HemY [Ferrigenium kumadai]